MNGHPVNWPRPPLMADMEQMVRLMTPPLETSARLELLRRQLNETTDAPRLAALLFALEQIRTILDRQLRWCLGELADRAGAVEQLNARVQYLEGRLAQVERRQQDELNSQP